MSNSTTIRLWPAGRMIINVALLMFGLLQTQPNNALAQVTGSGTINKIPKWTATSAIGDSVITESSGNIGIGTSTPGSKLEVVGGNIMLQNSNPVFFTYDTAGTVNNRQFYFWNSGGRLIGRWVNDGNSSVAAESITLQNNGNMGIGTITPNRLLHIRDTASAPVFTGARVSTSIDGSDPVFETLHEVSNKGFRWRLGNGGVSDFFLDYTTNGFAGYSTYLTVLNTGNVGIGTTNPEARIHLYHSLTNLDNPFITIGPSVTNGMNFGLGGGTFGDKSYFLHARDVAGSAATFRILTNGTTRMFFAAAGNVGIGTTAPAKTLDVLGDINASGTVSGGNVIAKYQDVAEWVPATNDIPAGSVVVLDAERSNHVLPSNRSYDTRVAGVVSANPGVILGEAGEGKVMVATTGRVRVKVDATRFPIRVGDLLVTSDKKGIAMRSRPLTLGGGSKIHRPGTLIGKALEPLNSGIGEILVLLSLQ